MSSFKTTTPSQSSKYQKWVISGPLHPPKGETVKNESFQDHHTLPKVSTVKNEFFQDHHTLPKEKLVQKQQLKL